MIRPEQIPDEVVAEAEYEACKNARPNIRDVIAAALAAWPGVDCRPGAKVTKTWRDPGKIILPLPMESSDD